MIKVNVLQRKFLTGIFALTLTVSSFAQNKSEIRFMWWGGDSRHKATLEAVKLFEAKNPTIKVNSEYLGWAGYNEKLTLGFMGKNSADLLQVNWNMLYMLGADNYYDLKKSGLDLSQYSKELLDQCTIGGKVVGIPISTNGRVFFFNKATFDKAGIAVPKTFADMIAAAPVLQEKISKDARVMILGNYDAFLMILLYCEQKYDKPFINNKTNTVSYTEAELKGGFDWYNDMVSKGVFCSIAESQSIGATSIGQDPRFVTGEYAGYYGWSGTTGALAGSVASGQLVVVPVTPEYGAKPGAIYKITMTYAMYAKTKFPKQTAALLNFILTDPEAVKVQKLERGVPSNKGAAKVLDEAGELKGLAYEAQLAADKSAGMAINAHFEDPEIQRVYQDVMEFLSKEGSQASSTKVISKTNEYLKEAFAK